MTSFRLALLAALRRVCNCRLVFFSQLTRDSSSPGHRRPTSIFSDRVGPPPLWRALLNETISRRQVDGNLWCPWRVSNIRVKYFPSWFFLFSTPRNSKKWWKRNRSCCCCCFFFFLENKKKMGCDKINKPSGNGCRLFSLTLGLFFFLTLYSLSVFLCSLSLFSTYRWNR